MSKLNIFIIYTKSLNNRNNYINSSISFIKNLCDKNNIEINIVAINTPEIDEIDRNKEIYDKKINLEKIDNCKYNDSIIKLNYNQISNIEKHRTALNQVVDKEYNIILEDDVIISKDFIKNIEELFADLSILDNIDMLCTCDFIYDGDDKLKLKSFRDYNKILVSKSSYFINKNMAKELYDYLDNYKYDMKTTITKFIDNNNFDVKFLNKCLFLEGSKVGIFTSSIRNKNFLSQNTNYIELVKIGSNSTITDENLKLATDIYNTIENLKNPEIYHLYGLIYYKKGDIDNAKKYLTLAANNIRESKAYYDKNNEIINNCINIYKTNQIDIDDFMKHKSIYH